MDEVFVTINGVRHYLWRAVDQDQMNTVEVVNAYKSLTFVERAFRNLKTVQ